MVSQMLRPAIHPLALLSAVFNLAAVGLAVYHKAHFFEVIFVCGILFIMDLSIAQSWQDGVIRFLQGNGATRDDQPGRFYRYLAYGVSFSLCAHLMFGYGFLVLFGYLPNSEGPLFH
jgi:hypothetical protein